MPSQGEAVKLRKAKCPDCGRELETRWNLDGDRRLIFPLHFASNKSMDYCRSSWQTVKDSQYVDEVKG